MIEFADDYIMQLLTTQWQLLVGKPADGDTPAVPAASLEVWRRSFSSRAIQAHIDAAYDVFVTQQKELVFYEAWTPVLFTLSQYTIAISLDDQNTSGEFFHHGNPGGFGMGDPEEPTEDEFSSMQVGTVGFYILSPNKHILSFIHYFVRMAVHSGVDDLIDDLGLDQAHRLSAATLICPAEFAPNGRPQVHGRKLELVVECIDTAERLGGPRLREKKPLLVHETDTYVDRLVDRGTREETPLESRLPGRVNATK